MIFMFVKQYLYGADKGETKSYYNGTLKPVESIKTSSVLQSTNVEILYKKYTRLTNEAIFTFL